MSALRVLHCPMVVGGNPQGLARAERELGLESWSVAFQAASYVGQQVDEVLVDDHSHRIIFEAKKWGLLWRAIRNYDVIHFNFGKSILPPRLADSAASQYPGWMNRLYHLYARLLDMNDLYLLSKLGKGILVTFQGDDARQGDFSLANFEISIASEVSPNYYSSDASKRWIISKFDRYADRIFYLNPDLAHVLSPQATFMPYGHLDLRDWQALPMNEAGLKKPTLIHAPSHRQVKGTKYVLEAVKRLQQEGVEFEFVLVEGLSHHEARRLYERADILVDQLFAGWYGGLAVELMALGRPVMCYIREGDLQYIPPQMREELPIINVTPTTFYTVLKEWLTERKHEFPELGRRSRAYVEKWHDPLKIATMLKNEYETILASKRLRSRS